MWRFYREWEKTTPREVKDGIRSQTRGGSFASSWWGKRWLEVLQSFGWDNRLQRGRSYARRGQVVDLAVGPGGVTGRVQGSRPRPYDVQIRLSALTEAQWDQAVAALEERPLFLGQLLAGEMPAEIEEAFEEAGAYLFPQHSTDLKMRCSCPDGAVPCKHLAAVYYLLAEWLDRDPFLLFELRGRDRESLMAALRERRGAEEGAATEVAEPPEPLSVDDFWTDADLQLDPDNEAAPTVPQALLRALGDPAGWTEAPLVNLLRPVYATVSQRAAELLDGGEPEADPIP